MRIPQRTSHGSILSWSRRRTSHCLGALVTDAPIPQRHGQIKPSDLGTWGWHAKKNGTVIKCGVRHLVLGRYQPTIICCLRTLQLGFLGFLALVVARNRFFGFASWQLGDVLKIFIRFPVTKYLLLQMLPTSQDFPTTKNIDPQQILSCNHLTKIKQLVLMVDWKLPRCSDPLQKPVGIVIPSFGWFVFQESSRHKKARSVDRKLGSKWTPSEVGDYTLETNAGD